MFFLHMFFQASLIFASEEEPTRVEQCKVSYLQTLDQPEKILQGTNTAAFFRSASLTKKKKFYSVATMTLDIRDKKNV